MERYALYISYYIKFCVFYNGSMYKNLMIFVGKYYLVDARYQQTDGYLGPYRGIRYHLPDFQRGGRPKGLKETFNRWHSSLRSCIERAFGVWKAR